MMGDPDPREMIQELRDALGLPDIAIPKPPAQVWTEALDAVRSRNRLLGWAHDILSRDDYTPPQIADYDGGNDG